MAAYRDGKQWRWRKQVRLPGTRPKRLSGTPSVNTKAAAEEDEVDAVKAYREGRYVAPEAPTLAAVEEDYLAQVELHKSPGLHLNRKNHLTHLIQAFGRTRLDRIEPRMIDRFTKAKLDEGYAVGSVNQILVALSNVFTWARAEKLVIETARVPLLETPDKSLLEVQHLEQVELDALVQRASGQTRRMILVAAYTGVRPGELVSLQWGDVSGKRLTVRRNLYKGQERPPKGKRARDIPLCATAVHALHEQRHDRCPQVFIREDGDRLTYDQIQPLAESLGFSWRTLRHTFGTLLSSRGVPLKAIQQWMGHQDIKTTMVYARYSPVMDGAISVLDTRETWQYGANTATPSPAPDGDGKRNPEPTA